MKAITIASCFVFLLFAVTTFAQDSVPKELDEYIALPDDSYTWKIIEKNSQDDKNSYLIELTSQTWQGIVWQHHMYLVEPANLVSKDGCILFITGGAIGRTPKATDFIMADTVASISGAPVALLFQVPNQPLLGDYYEDALIGETLLKAKATKDTTWPLLFPMAKSAVRGMDAATEVIKQERDRDISKFVVTGASKRGWTTWLTAATQDKRVIAIAPIVIDTLNMSAQMKYQLETWGAFSESIGDYTSRNLVQEILIDDENASGFSPEEIEFNKRLWKMIDPYSYRERVTVPKYLIHGTNDPYWTVDATKHYWDDLTGVKYILTLPNAGHGLDNQQPKALMCLAAYAKNAFASGNWPKMEWSRNETDDAYSVSVTTNCSLKGIKIWSAKSETKDFRNSKWEGAKVNVIGNNKDADITLATTVPKPKSGHIAYYVEIETELQGVPCSFTTQVWRD
ncbi:MAG: PhoPQ-activated pathogenicity-related family protein [Thermoguttaceae bacterium]